MFSEYSLRRNLRRAAGVGMGLMPLVSNAASAHPFEDGLANAISWVAITVMPVVAIYLFWKIHVLPEVIAEKRHHPQAEAIKVLCLLSLVFGGLLWPLAWLWAYMNPIQFPVVRGTRRTKGFHGAAHGGAGHGEHRASAGETASATATATATATVIASENVRQQSGVRAQAKPVSDHGEVA
jgi:K+-transporting ATPase A subunit